MAETETPPSSFKSHFVWRAFFIFVLMADPPVAPATAATTTPLADALPATTAQQSDAATNDILEGANGFICSVLGHDANITDSVRIVEPVPFNLMPPSNGIVNQPIDVSLIAAPTAAAAPIVALAQAPHPQARSRAQGCKCKIKGCTHGEVQPPPEMVQCSNDGCTKMVHRLCYIHIICNKTKRTAHDEYSFCTCAHHDGFIRSMSDANLNWTNDGANGRNDPQTSQFFLIRWLSTDDNYNLYRNPTGGRTKIAIAGDVARYINLQDVRVERTAEMVEAKINWIQGLMRETYDWTITPTGEGIREREGFASLKEKVCCFVFNIILFTSLTTYSSKHR